MTVGVGAAAGGVSGPGWRPRQLRVKMSNLKAGHVRILDTTVCSGSLALVWLFSPAWDAIKLTLPGGWLHLSFRGHRP